MSSDAPLVFVRVLSGDEPQQLDLSDRLLSFEYNDNERRADRCKFVIDNWTLENFDDPVFQKGTVIEVTWGFPGNLAPVRTVTVTKVKGFQQLTVEATGGEIHFHTRGRTRCFENVRVSDVAKTIAEENGFDDERQIIQTTSEVYDSLQQAGLTDAQYLKRLAHAEGFEWFIDYDGFHFHERDFAQVPIRALTWYVDPGKGEIKSINIENDVSGKPGLLVVKGRDPMKKTTSTGRGSNEDTDRDGLAKVTEILQPGIQSAVAASTAGASAQLALGIGAARVLYHVSRRAIGVDVQREADKRFRRIQQTAVKCTAEIVGDPNLIAKTVVEMRGLGKRLSGNYYIREATHKIDGSGYAVSIKANSDGDKGHARISDLLFVQPKGSSGGLTATDLASAVDDLAAACQSERKALQDGGVVPPVVNGVRVIRSSLGTLGTNPNDKTAKRAIKNVAQSISRLATSANAIQCSVAAIVVAQQVDKVGKVDTRESQAKVNEGTAPEEQCADELVEEVVVNDDGTRSRRWVDKRCNRGGGS